MIFQIDSNSVKEAFIADNYKIEFSIENEQVENHTCVIYFSSNEIYYPNTADSFNYSITQRDKYEWRRNRFPKARKHIFIRDIQKQWYLGGINSSLDHPDKLVDFLKMETNGFEIFTIGSSAGGFAAILFGSLLRAKRVYAFNAQLNLYTTLKASNSLTDPILFQHLNNENINRFYDLSLLLNSTTEYFYFQSALSKIDTDQFNSISFSAQNQLKTIRFQTSNHGFPFLRINLPIILNFSPIQLAQYVNKTFHPIFFSFHLIGVVPTINFVFKALKDRFLKKRLEAKLKTKSIHSFQ